MDKDKETAKFSMSDTDYGNYVGLRIQANSIAQQQRILRNLARVANQRASGQNSTGNVLADRFSWHRRIKLAREARITHLIRAFIKGTPYSAVEHKLTVHTIPPLELMFMYASKGLTDMIGDVGEFLKWLGYAGPDEVKM
jgi:hypothetical protein